MKKRKILIVEDEFIGALGLAETLGEWDQEVCGMASTGQDAILMAERERPDLVMMDIGLRGKMNGIEAAKKITDRLNIPVIFMSGYLEENLEEADLCGPFHFISKPVDYDELEAILENL